MKPILLYGNDGNGLHLLQTSLTLSSQLLRMVAVHMVFLPLVFPHDRLSLLAPQSFLQLCGSNVLASSAHLHHTDDCTSTQHVFTWWCHKLYTQIQKIKIIQIIKLMNSPIKYTKVIYDNIFYLFLACSGLSGNYQGDAYDNWRRYQSLCMITARGTKVYKVYKIYKYIWGDTINFLTFYQ